MSDLTYYCWACYGRNAAAAGSCVHCGGEIEAPPSTSYADRLLWALEHPVSEIRVDAAFSLGSRRENPRSRASAHTLALESPDPFLAAAALESLVAISGLEPTRGLLESLANSRRAHLRAVAPRLLRREGQGCDSVRGALLA